MEVIHDILRRLGITKRYRGYDAIVYCVQLILEDDRRLQSVIKSVYSPAAVHFDCRPASIERNMRTAVQRAWQLQPSLLCRLAGYQLTSAPSTSEFLALVCHLASRKMGSQMRGHARAFDTPQVEGWEAGVSGRVE